MKIPIDVNRIILYGTILIILSVPPTALKGQSDTVSAGSTPTMTLSAGEAVELALTQNYDIIIARYDHDQASADFRRTASVFLPRLSLTESFVTTDDPLTAFGLKLRQESVTMADFDPAVLNDPPQIRNFTTRAEVQQPILNFEGFFGRHAASRAADAAEAKLLRTRHGVELGVKMAYYGLVLARNSLDVVLDAARAAAAYRDQARNFRDAGMIQESDYLMAEMRVVELEMKKIGTENGIRDAEDRLRLSLGITENIPIVPTDTLGFAAPQAMSYDLGELFRSRSDMKAMQYGIDAASAGLKMQKASLLPSLNAFASYEWNNDRIDSRHARSWMVGAIVRWNIFSGFDRIGGIQKASARLSSLETEYERMKTSGAQEIASAKRSLETSAKGVELASIAVRQATETLRVRGDRYGKGMERTADLLQAEAALSNARLTYLNSLYGHSAAVFMLEFLLERKVTQ